MKKKRYNTLLNFKAISVTTVLLLSILISTANAAKDSTSEISIDYSFERPVINQVTINDISFDRIIIFNAPNNGNIGEPNLPRFDARILIPQGYDIKNIDITPGEKTLIGTSYNVEPVLTPVKLSELKSNDVQIYSDYSKDNIYPSELYTKVGSYYFRGYQILFLTLNPVQYNPETGEIYYFEDISVDVDTEYTGQISPLYRNSEFDKIDLLKKIDNPSVLETYNSDAIETISEDDYQLLILTIEDYKDEFEPLKQTHDSQGLKTEIKTLNDISMFPGSVTTEDIREFIKEQYIEFGIEYVIIGGDYDVIPTKDLWVQAWSGGDVDEMPSDIYYSCLDGPFNYDGDDKWGEPQDGLNGEDVDLLAEVYVGRASVGSSTEINNFVDKTVQYINSGGYSSGNALMVGEFLWSNPDTYGGDYMDELVDGSSAHMYTTIGIPSSTYTISYLYDRDWPSGDWPKSEIINRINDGALIINHLGHASYDYNLKMNNGDINSLTNDQPCFIYSQGCMAGGFDNGDCIAEYLTVKTDNAAFAVIMNARYGWGTPGSTDGASQRFHREFWDAIFGEEITEIGKANQDSKEDNINMINYPCMRWIYYQLNLFGDPSLSFTENENTKPEKPEMPVGEKKGQVGEEYEFTSSTNDLDGDQIYFKWDFGDGTFSEWLGPYASGEEVSVLKSWDKKGTYQVKVKARDEHRADSEWSDPLPVKMPIINNFPIISFILQLIEKFFSQLYSLIT